MLHVTDLVLTSFLLTLNRFDIVESEYVNSAGFLSRRLKSKRTFFKSESQEKLGIFGIHKKNLQMKAASFLSTCDMLVDTRH